MPQSIPIDLPKRITGDALVQACIDAAKEIGYKAKPVDKFGTRYSLGSLHEHRDYDETTIRIGNLFPAMRIIGIKKGREQDRFFIWTGLPHGFASSTRVQQYLQTLSRYI